MQSEKYAAPRGRGNNAFFLSPCVTRDRELRATLKRAFIRSGLSGNLENQARERLVPGI